MYFGPKLLFHFWLVLSMCVYQSKLANVPCLLVLDLFPVSSNNCCGQLPTAPPRGQTINYIALVLSPVTHQLRDYGKALSIITRFGPIWLKSHEFIFEIASYISKCC